jgi:PhzF family phenazine biosynthesis protein
MKQIPIFQVDAFTNQLFRGNPAAVCVLDDWLEDKTMQAIAAENNLSETAYVIPQGDDYAIRWFTPVSEVELCGHATLASAFVLFQFYRKEAIQLVFHSRYKGILSVQKDSRYLLLDFPADEPQVVEVPDPLVKMIGGQPLTACIGSTDWLLEYDSQETIRELTPDFKALAAWDARGIIVTAPGYDCDFVSRFFAPAEGIDEDPVTGSAHTLLVPFWASKMKQKSFVARQLSVRGGELLCEYAQDRVKISGQAQLYLQGEIFIP